jgi:riboflavin biosynthesis pyrimidine reductase
VQLINVMSQSLNAKIASYSLQSDAERINIRLTNEFDQRFLQELISTADGIVLGANSIRGSNGVLPFKNLKTGTYPTWYIFSNHGFPPEHALWAQVDVPRVLVSQRPLAVHGPGVSNICYSSASDAAQWLYSYCRANGHKKVLLFGGEKINNLFYAAGLVQELYLTLAPVLLRDPLAPCLVSTQLPFNLQFTLISVRQESDYVFLHYKTQTLDGQNIDA